MVLKVRKIRLTNLDEAPLLIHIQEWLNHLKVRPLFYSLGQQSESLANSLKASDDSSAEKTSIIFIDRVKNKFNSD
jgi:hypothetical protein